MPKYRIHAKEIVHKIVDIEAPDEESAWNVAMDLDIEEFVDDGNYDFKVDDDIDELDETEPVDFSYDTYKWH